MSVDYNNSQSINLNFKLEFETPRGTTESTPQTINYKFYNSKASISTSISHSCLVKTNNQAVCWGKMIEGNLAITLMTTRWS